MKSIPSSAIAIFVRHITFNCILFVSFLIVLISDILNVIMFRNTYRVILDFDIRNVLNPIPKLYHHKVKEKESG